MDDNLKEILKELQNQNKDMLDLFTNLVVSMNEQTVQLKEELKEDVS